MAGLSVFLVNRRRAVFTAVMAVQLLTVSVVLAHRHVSAGTACVLSFPIELSLYFSVQDSSSLPLTRLIPLPLEGPPLGLPYPLSAPVTAIAHYSVVQLERSRAASSSDVLLSVTEVVMGSHLWRTQT